MNVDIMPIHKIPLALVAKNNIILTVFWQFA